MTATAGVEDAAEKSTRSVFLLDSDDPSGVTINSVLVHENLAVSTCDVTDDCNAEQGDVTVYMS